MTDLKLSDETYHVPIEATNRLDATDMSGTPASGYVTIADLAVSKHAESADLNTITQSGMYRINTNPNAPSGVSYGQLLVIHGKFDTIIQMAFGYTSGIAYLRMGNPPDVGGNGAWSSWFKLWNEGNDGSGSGLDADLLDGKDSTQFAPATQTANIYHNAAQSIPNAAWTTLFFNSEINDNGGWHNTSGDTDKVFLPAGEYQIIVQNLSFASSAAGLRGLAIKDSTGNTWNLKYISAVSGVNTFVDLIAQRQMAGTYIYVQAYQTSGGALNLQAYPKLTIIKIK